MLTEFINDKRFRIFLVVLVVGIMMTFMSVPDCITLSKDPVDVTKLWDADLSTFKNGAHICLDITLVQDTIGSEITTSKTMGVTTSEKESARYYLLPLISTDSNDYLYAYPFLVVKMSTQYNSVMTSQITKTENWWNNPEATFEQVPTSGIHLDGRIKNMPAKMRKSLEESLDPGDRFEDYFLPYVFEPIAVPKVCYIMAAIGILCLIASVVIIVLVVKSFKETPDHAPTTGAKYEYYGPQGADQPYQSGYSTTARTANIANKGPSVKDMVGGAFASSGTPSVSGTLPPTTPATPFGNQTGPQGTEPVLSSLKQRQPVMPEAQPYVSPFASTTPAGADASANPLYGGSAAPTTPTEYVSPLANQSGNLNYNPAYGQAPGENYANAPATELTADALAANSQFLGGMNMDPMLAQTAPIAPPTNPLETLENQQGPAGGLNPALTGQRVQPSPYTQPQATPYAAQQQPAQYTAPQPAPYSPQPAPYTPQPAPYTAPQPAPTNYNGQNV